MRTEAAVARSSPETATSRRVLVVGVGHPFLRDLSIGPVLVTELSRLDWPAGVEVDDWSFNPIAIVQRLEALADPYDRIVVLSAVERGRVPGQVTRYRWSGDLPDAAEIQQRVGEAVMGIINLDNLLIVGQHFGAFPPDVVVVEVEPDDTGWGDGFTPRIEAALPEVIATVRRAAMDGDDG